MFRLCSGNGRSSEFLPVSWMAWQSLLRRRLSLARAFRLGMFYPAHSYLGSSLAEMRDEIESGFKQAILEALAPG